jgi:hypothetical protein
MHFQVKSTLKNNHYCNNKQYHVLLRELNFFVNNFHQIVLIIKLKKINKDSIMKN